MITEDYVSFETAKLLREKYFNEYCRTYYKKYHIGFNEIYNSPQLIDNQSLFEMGLGLSAPTLQMAMKWLREVHDIAINIGWGEIFEDKFQWWCIILNQKDGSILRESEYHATYEEACEAAIKYCLENLI